MNAAEYNKSASSPTHKVVVNGNFIKVFTIKTVMPINGPYANDAMKTGTSSKWNSKKAGKNGTGNLTIIYKIAANAENIPAFTMNLVVNIFLSCFSLIMVSSLFLNNFLDTF